MKLMIIFILFSSNLHASACNNLFSSSEKKPRVNIRKQNVALEKKVQAIGFNILKLNAYPELRSFTEVGKDIFRATLYKNGKVLSLYTTADAEVLFYKKVDGEVTKIWCSKLAL